MTVAAVKLFTLTDWGYFNVNEYGAQNFLQRAIKKSREMLPESLVIAGERFPAVAPDTDVF